jgi:hypothetical protein
MHPNEVSGFFWHEAAGKSHAAAQGCVPRDFRWSRMLRAQDAQEQPFAGGNETVVRKKRLGDFFPMN